MQPQQVLWVRFLSKAGQRRCELTKVGTQRKFRTKSILGSKLVENWGRLWTTPQGFVMIHGKTDLKPFRKLSYCECDCNWDDTQNQMNVCLDLHAEFY
jgi:predicted DNA-binding WGR domain protein